MAGEVADDVIPDVHTNTDDEDEDDEFNADDEHNTSLVSDS